MLAGEAAKHLFGMKDMQLAGEEIVYCLKTYRSIRSRLVRNEHCRNPHQRVHLEPLEATADKVTFRTILDLAGRPSVPQVKGEAAWLSQANCPRCGDVPLRRFGAPGVSLGRCRCCGRDELLSLPRGVRSVLPQEDLAACMDRPLSELGLAPGGAVGVAGGDTWTYFLVGQPPALTPAGVPQDPTT
jgi:hypothetical protein